MENQPGNEVAKNEQPILGKDAFKLAIFAFFTTGICVVTFLNTKDKIENNITQLTIKKLEEISPGASKELELTEQWVQIQPPKLGLKKPKKAYAIARGTASERWILPITAPDGYGGAIELLLGLDKKGEITGVRVIPPHSETPGLGDKIEIKKSEWIKSFNGMSLANTTKTDWGIKKDGGSFDSFTGASITPRAIIKSVHKGLTFFNQQQNQLKNTAYQETLNP